MLLWLAGNCCWSRRPWLGSRFNCNRTRSRRRCCFRWWSGACWARPGRRLCASTGMPSRRLALVGAAAWGLLVVVGQDYIGHRHRLRLYDEALDRQSPLAAVVAAERPEIAPAFRRVSGRRRARAQPLWWSLDLVLTCRRRRVAVTALGVSAATTTHDS